MFDISKSIEAQREFCERTGAPHFAPHKGVCWKCGRNIYNEVDKGTYKTGISVEAAASRLVTGCPHCNRSYCD
jgi:ribosomal protein S27AE